MDRDRTRVWHGRDIQKADLKLRRPKAEAVNRCYTGRHHDAFPPR